MFKRGRVLFTALMAVLGSAGFCFADDPTFSIGSVQSTITGAATAIGAALLAGAGIYAMYLGWKHYKKITAKI